MKERPHGNNLQQHHGDQHHQLCQQAQGLPPPIKTTVKARQENTASMPQLPCQQSHCWHLTCPSGSRAQFEEVGPASSPLYRHKRLRQDPAVWHNWSCVAEICGWKANDPQGLPESPAAAADLVRAFRKSLRVLYFLKDQVSRCGIRTSQEGKDFSSSSFRDCLARVRKGQLPKSQIVSTHLKFRGSRMARLRTLPPNCTKDQCRYEPLAATMKESTSS